MTSALEIFLSDKEIHVFAYLLTGHCLLSSEEGCVRGLVSSGGPYSNFGDQSFVAADPRLWNNLPAGLRQTDVAYEQFKRLLKTFVEIVTRCLFFKILPSQIFLLTYFLTYL